MTAQMIGQLMLAAGVGIFVGAALQRSKMLREFREAMLRQELIVRPRNHPRDER